MKCGRILDMIEGTELKDEFKLVLDSVSNYLIEEGKNAKKFARLTKLTNNAEASLKNMINDMYTEEIIETILELEKELCNRREIIHPILSKVLEYFPGYLEMKQVPNSNKSIINQAKEFITELSKYKDSPVYDDSNAYRLITKANETILHLNTITQQMYILIEQVYKNLLDLKEPPAPLETYRFLDSYASSNAINTLNSQLTSIYSVLFPLEEVLDECQEQEQKQI